MYILFDTNLADTEQALSDYFNVYRLKIREETSIRDKLVFAFLNKIQNNISWVRPSYPLSGHLRSLSTKSRIKNVRALILSTKRDVKDAYPLLYMALRQRGIAASNVSSRTPR